MKKLWFHLVCLIVSLNALAQPYSGTIFVDPDIITASDSSTLQSVTYLGQGIRTVFDRRVNNWIEINAYLFEVVWNDSLISEAVINPEFETVESARAEAEKYGWIIGQLPNCLRQDVDQIWIHRGIELFGGGNRSILIHTGQTELYEKDGILEETLVHEAAHTSLDAMHAMATGWRNAQVSDAGFISDYAEQFPDREDIAESFLLWLAVRYRQDRISKEDFDLITEAIPNRLHYFDSITCDLFPIVVDNTTALSDPDRESMQVTIYPNPTVDHLNLDTKGLVDYQILIFNAIGALLWRDHLSNDQSIDLSALPAGSYLMVLSGEGRLIRKKFTKL